MHGYSDVVYWLPLMLAAIIVGEVSCASCPVSSSASCNTQAEQVTKMAEKAAQNPSIQLANSTSTPATNQTFSQIISDMKVMCDNVAVLEVCGENYIRACTVSSGAKANFRKQVADAKKKCADARVSWNAGRGGASSIKSSLLYAVYVLLSLGLTCLVFN